METVYNGVVWAVWTIHEGLLPTVSTDIILVSTDIILGKLL